MKNCAALLYQRLSITFNESLSAGNQVNAALSRRVYYAPTLTAISFDKQYLTQKLFMICYFPIVIVYSQFRFSVHLFFFHQLTKYSINSENRFSLFNLEVEIHFAVFVQDRKNCLSFCSDIV